MNFRHLFSSYLVILSLSIIASIFMISKMLEQADHTKKMYTHPFTVSNAVADIQTSIVTMHRNMKDVVLSKNQLEIVELIEKVQQQETKVLHHFDTIYKFYLGDKKDIDVCYQLFTDWKKIRSEVIVHMSNEEIEQAVAITRGKGAQHIDKLYQQIKILKDFAFNKADEFYAKSMDDSNIISSIFVSALSTVISALIILWMIFGIIRTNKEKVRQQHLIDQNILSAMVSVDKQILDISNAFCRELNVTQNEIIGNTTEFLFTTEKQFNNFKTQIFTGKEYNGEIYIEIEGKQTWFQMEIFPESNEQDILSCFRIILHNISDKKRIEEISITDSLSGLHNRNYFEMVFEKEIKRCKRTLQPVSLLILDIDFFKQYNDHYGHQEGDHVIQAVASVLSKQAKRSSDYVFRIGGEEFLVLSHQKNYEQTRKLADSFLNAVENLQLEHQYSEASKYVTVSIGAIHCTCSNAFSADKLFKLTDQLLYQAKKEGRNRVCSQKMGDEELVNSTIELSD